MTFKEATDQLIAHGVTLAEIAEAFDVATNTIARARMDPDSPNARPAPPNWREVLAPFARARTEGLAGLAANLEAGIGQED